MKSTTALRNLFAALLLTSLAVMPASAGFFDLETKLTADDTAANDRFGSSVSISGNTAIVGAWGNDDGGSDSGSAYLFDVTTGNQLAKLTADDAAEDDNFGSPVSISGNTAIVGAWGNDDGGSNSGSAYLFDVTTGNQLAKLTADDAAEDDNFGSSVSISGNTAIVGAGGNDDGGSNSGSAYLFDVTTGNQLAKLTADDAAEDDNFGSSVSISGNTAIVGAVGNDDGGSNSGSAYLFDVTTGNQLTKLTADDAAAYDLFGSSVSISGNTVIVGAWGNDDGGSYSGSAYLFDMTTGNQLAKLTADDAAAGDWLGYSVSISDNTAIVGAWGNDDGGSNSGSAYLFDVTTGNQLAKLTSDSAATGGFGSSVSISSNTAIVGAWGNSTYLFNEVPEPTTLLLAAFASTSLLLRRRRSSSSP